MKRHKPIRARSERRERFERELDAITDALYARAGFACEICRIRDIYPLCETCRGLSSDLWCFLCTERAASGLLGHRHHRLRRSQGGGNGLENLMALCPADHQFVHDWPAVSYDRGWLLHPLTPSPRCA